MKYLIILLKTLSYLCVFMAGALAGMGPAEAEGIEIVTQIGFAILFEVLSRFWQKEER